MTSFSPIAACILITSGAGWAVCILITSGAGRATCILITSGVGRATCILITSLVGCLATCYDVIAACILITSVPGWGVIYYYVWFMLFLWPPSFVENYSTCCSRHSVYVLNNGFISRKFSKNLCTFAYFCHHTAIYSFSN